MKTLKNIAAVACVAALAVPAAVLAKGPSGDHGKSGQPHGNNTKPHHVNSKCKNPMVGFTLHGTLAQGSSPTHIVVDVKKGNHHARPWYAGSNQFTADSTTDNNGFKVTYVGDNPFTTPGAELHWKDWKVVVIGKVLKAKKHCTATNSTPPDVRKVMIIAPGSGESGSNESGSNESGSNESGANQS